MSNKDFQKGMVAGAKPFGDKLDQLADVSEQGVSDIKAGLDGITGVVNAVLDDLSVQEKKRIYDLDEATDIFSLEDDEKEFLVAVLTELANTIQGVSDLQKKYLLSICSVTNIPTPQTSLNLACIENIENMKTQKILLRHVMEFLFIGEQGYDFLDTYESTIFCYFSVNKRGIADIKATIERVFNAMGTEGIASRYTFVAGYEEIQEPQEQQEDTVSDETNEPQDIEVLNITNMVQIASGQKVSYKYKEIHLSSLINCSGVLEFDNCVIVYNEKDVADEITLSEGAEIRATNCTFICKGEDKNAFIALSESCTATFDKCLFEGCCYFFKSDKDCCLTITNCELHNCGTGFVVFNPCSVGKADISAVKITVDANLQYCEKDERKRSLASRLFEIVAAECLVDNVCVSNNDSQSIPPLNFFDIGSGIIKNSFFYRVSGSVSAKSVENCVFESCTGTVVSTYFSDGGTVKSCIFDGCSNVICASDDSTITQCKFINCVDSMIWGNTGAGIEISYCEFINYKNIETDKYQGTDFSDPSAGIRLHAGKGDRRCTVKKCVFDGVDINEGFLISASITGKVAGYTAKVEDCDFRNCSTRRKSGKIIKTYSSYFGLFNKLNSELAVTVSNCRGLDQIKQNGTGVCSDDAILSAVGKSKAHSGAASTIVTGALGVVGGPVGLAVSLGVNAVVKNKDKKEQEKKNNAKSE